MTIITTRTKEMLELECERGFDNWKNNRKKISENEREIKYKKVEIGEKRRRGGGKT